MEPMKHPLVPRRAATGDDDRHGPIIDALERVLSDIPAAGTARAELPDNAAKAIARRAAKRAAVLSGSLALPPGPLGFVTVLPDLYLIWQTQRQMVADIFGVYGRSAELTRTHMLYCLFRHAASQVLRDVAVRGSQRVVIQQLSGGALRNALGGVGRSVTQRLAGNAAGRVIRSNLGLITRIPTGWACFSACNFIFMGGQPRAIDPGGLFIVHMFTRTGDRSAIDMSVAMGTDATKELIGDIEQDAALLASEDNDFLIRMGVSRKLLTEVMYQQKAIANEEDKSTRRCLTQAEVREYNVVNIDG